MVKKLLKRMFIFAFVMIIVGLVLGVYTREMLRPVEKKLGIEQLLPIETRVFLLHGHAIFYGGLLPIALASVTFILRKQLGERAIRNLNRAFIVFVVGAILVLGLSFYKSTHILVQLMGGHTDLSRIDEQLFGGSVMVRSLAFTLAHPTFATGVVWYIVVLWKRLNAEKQK